MSNTLDGLSIPEEPAALRARTRALVERAPSAGRTLVEAGDWIAGPLWDQWGPALERSGMDQERFRQVVRDYRRELWLWVMGERTWPQCAGGLLGRVRRRATVGAADPAPPGDDAARRGPT